MTVEPRLYLDAPLRAGARLDLPRDQAHYLITVMRRKSGDGVRVFNGRDGEWRAVVAEATRRAATLRIEARLREQRAAPDLALYFAPVKKARTDFIVEKATELGAASITPVMTARTIADRVKTERLEALAREAAEQTERLDLPEIGPPVALTALIKAWDPARRLIFADEAGDSQSQPWGGDDGRARPIAEVLQAFAPHPTPTLPSRGGGETASDAHDPDRYEVSADGAFIQERPADTSPSPAGEGRGRGRPTPGAQALGAARRMRSDPTPAEARLWRILKTMKAPGFHFRRQAAVGPFVADFACLSKRLVVEADGGGHGGSDDAERDAWFERRGYRVLRFWNTEILENPDGVATRIAEALAHPTPTLPSRGGSVDAAPGETQFGVSPEDDQSSAADASAAPSPRGEGRGGGRADQWAILIGPEGGFAPDERALLRAQSFVVPVSLGPRILRADTAVAAAMSVWQALLGDWR